VPVLAVSKGDSPASCGPCSYQCALHILARAPAALAWKHAPAVASVRCVRQYGARPDRKGFAHFLLALFSILLVSGCFCFVSLTEMLCGHGRSASESTADSSRRVFTALALAILGDVSIYMVFALCDGKIDDKELSSAVIIPTAFVMYYQVSSLIRCLDLRGANVLHFAIRHTKCPILDLFLLLPFLIYGVVHLLSVAYSLCVCLC
jgi:hypothetical protein